MERDIQKVKDHDGITSRGGGIGADVAIHNGPKGYLLQRNLASILGFPCVITKTAHKGFKKGAATYVVDRELYELLYWKFRQSLHEGRGQFEQV